MASVLELEGAIQTVVATLENIGDWKTEQEECVHLFIKGQIHCFLTANRVWENNNMSSCTVSGEVGSIAIP